MRHGDREISFARSVRHHWRNIFVEGLILIVLGFLAILMPAIASWAINIFLGWIFLVSGLIGLVTTLAGRRHPGFWWALLSAFVGCGVGIVLIEWPGSGAMSLTYLLIAFFLIEGLATIMFAVEHRRHLSGRWEWMFASGIVDVALAVLVISGLPGTAAWVVGLLIGINMVFGGSALIAMAVHGYANDLGAHKR